jgi:SPP1 gp7 family putative phage head morphogenesis protein
MQQRIIQMLHRDSSHHVSHFQHQLEFSLDTLGAKAEEAYLLLVGPLSTRTQNGVGTVTLAVDRQHRLIKMSDEELADQVVHSMALKQFVDGPLRRDYEVQYRRVIQMTSNTINLGLATSSAIEPHEVERLVSDGVERRILLDIPGQARDAILRGIQEGHELGQNPRETAAAIRGLVPAGPFPNAGPKYRAELIARTETLHAQRLSSLAAYKQSDQVSRVVAFDGTDDEECAARNGEEFSFDEAEAEMEDTHPNCVLAFAPVVA